MRRWVWGAVWLAMMAPAWSEPVCVAGEAALFQVSTIDALLAGAYDGQIRIDELTRHGDFGIGTFAALDGEMVVLDGRVWQVRADGVARRVAADERTPFADVVPFAPCATLEVPRGLALAELESWLDGKLGNLNLFYALRVDGDFERMKTRAVPAQKKPYPVLAEVAKTQPVFDLGSTSGSLVAIRSPAFSRGISVPGYHWHFLRADERAGGHVLGFSTVQATVKIQPVAGFTLQLPPGDGFAALDLARDRSGELNAVEK